MKKIIPFVIGGLIFLGCGGNGNKNELKTIKGKVADGYLENAKVCLDKNNNLACDEDEPFTYTNNGEYSLDVKQGDELKYSVLVEADEKTIDLDNNEYVKGEFKLFSPAGYYSFISPFTTLIKTKMDLNPHMNVKDAELAIKTQIGMLDADLFKNYIQDNSYTSEKLHTMGKILTDLFIENYKNVKNNIDSSNTKAYVLGFSFALTHTAYDNVDIKGAVKKTFKPSFTGIVTIPNDKEKVNILYKSVLNKLDVLKTAKVFTPEDILVGKKLYDIYLYSLYDDNSSDYFVEIDKTEVFNNNIHWIYLNDDINISDVNKYTDVDEIFKKIKTYDENFSVSYKDGIVIGYDEWEGLKEEWQISKVAEFDLGGKELALDDVVSYAEVNLSGKTVKFKEGDKQYKITWIEKGIPLDVAINAMENNYNNEDDGPIKLEYSSIDDLLENYNFYNSCKFVAETDNSGYIECNGTKDGSYRIFGYNNHKYVFVDNYVDFDEKEYGAWNYLFAEINGSVYAIEEFTTKDKIYKDIDVLYNKSAMNSILEALKEK